MRLLENFWLGINGIAVVLWDATLWVARYILPIALSAVIIVGSDKLWGQGFNAVWIVCIFWIAAAVGWAARAEGLDTAKEVRYSARM